MTCIIGLRCSGGTVLIGDRKIKDAETKFYSKSNNDLGTVKTDLDS